MKFIWKHLGTRIWLIVTSIVLVLALVISIVLTTVPIVGNSLTLVFGGERANITEDRRDEQYDREFTSKADARAAAEDFVIEVEKEGAILLKNENDALPITKDSPAVSVFGKNSVNLVYSGSGSANSSSTSTKTLYESLEAAGISYNQTLKDFYDDNARSGSGRPANPSMNSGQRLAGFGIGETPISSYGQDLESSYSQYNDAAIVVLSRVGGEGWDLPRSMYSSFGTDRTLLDDAASEDSHYLELGKHEKALLEYVEERFETVIVLLNTGTTMELGELQADENIDAILWMGFPGATGVMAIGQLLVGETTEGEQLSPSGYTTDTWAADFTADPSWYNTGIYGSQYGNRYLYDGAETSYAFVNYEEGIYVGYRYWETRGYEELQDDPDSTWYEQNVVYPFGYGLSYTTFDWDISFETASNSVVEADGTITVNVTVTNTGDWAGKDVVQLYYTAPYGDATTNTTKIEKAYVVLADFAKTPTLYPADQADADHPNSATVTLTLDVRDMASYDYVTDKAYVLDDGDYTVSVRSDAHTAEDSATYTVEEKVVLNTDTDARGNEVTVTNRFDDVSAGIFGDTEYSDYISRSDFAGTVPADYLADEERTLTAELKDALDLSIRRSYTQSDEGMPWQVTGAAPSTTPVDSGLSLEDMLYDEDGNYVGSVDFDDPRWETLLNEISIDEMKTLIGYAAFRTNAVEGVNGVVNKPMTNDADGPSGFTSFISESVIYGTASYQGECVMGATWNVDLARRMGELVGEEGLAGNENGDGMPYTGWYAPAANIHRSPFGGRNWEYYSEDGLLSGKLAAGVIEGASSKGIICYMKHFAVNDQETDREYNGILVWANEQSMREIYLKPFEIAVKEGGAMGMMSSFNRLGMTWAGGSYALLTEILRDEWGFRGAVITDYSMNTYTQVDLMIRAGGDLFLTQASKTFAKDDDATQITLLRNATKNILYVTANSNVMSLTVDGYKMPLWQEVMIYIDVAIVVGLAVWGVLIILSAKKKEKSGKQ